MAVLVVYNTPHEMRLERLSTGTTLLIPFSVGHVGPETIKGSAKGWIKARRIRARKYPGWIIAYVKEVCSEGK